MDKRVFNLITKVYNATSCISAIGPANSPFFFVEIEMFISVSKLDKHDCIPSGNWLTVSLFDCLQSCNSDKIIGLVCILMGYLPVLLMISSLHFCNFLGKLCVFALSRIHRTY